MTIVPGIEDLDALALLVSVIELGSLSQAAARHGVSQPAASTRISRLERSLGLRLVDRSTVGCTATPAGASVGEWSREILATADRMGRAVHALRTHRSSLTIAASLTIAEQLLPKWLAVLHRQHPTLKVHVVVANSATVVDRIRASDATIGFVETTEPLTGLTSRVVAYDELVVVVAPTHPWCRRRRPLTALDLARTPLVLREPGSGSRISLERAMSRAGHLLAEPILELTSTSATRSAVAAGVGPAVMSELAVADDVEAGRLAVVAVDEIDLRRPLRAVWKGAQPAVVGWLARAAAWDPARP